MRSLLRASSLALLVVGFAITASAQELKPHTIWDGTGAWGTDGNWDNGVPGEGVVGVVNGGSAEVTSAVDAFDDLAIKSGGVDVGGGGTLDVTGGLIVGGDGTLGLSGGSVKSGSLAVTGTLAVGEGTIETGAAAFTADSTIDLAAGTTLADGSSIPLLTAGSIASQQPNFTVGGATPELARGLGLRLGSDGAVSVGSVPIAIVNRTSGNVTVTNAGGGDITKKAYTFSSENGLLNPDNFSGLGDGWAQASSTATELTELNFAGSATLPSGGNLDFGSIWGGTTVTPREEDLSVSVLLDDGTIISGAVEYTGPANDLVLNVDPATGNATLQNLSASVGDFDLVGYSILSDSGSLNAEAFGGIAEDGWTTPNPQAAALGQINLEGSKVFGNGTVVDLGNIFTVGGTQDLVLEFGVVGSDRAQPGTVEYGAGGGGDGGGPVDPPACNPNTQGDLDGNGTVEFADFLTLSANFGNAGTHSDGDIDCNGTVEFADFLTLSANFGNTVGAGAASVPEPATGLMILIGTLGMLKFRKRGMHIAGLLIIAGLMVTPTETWAQEINTRFVRIHPQGPNSQINNTIEARGILDGTVLDVIINEDITVNDEVVTADWGGGPGNFSNDQNPYGNGVEGTDMSDFIQHMSGVWEIPAGDYTVGFGSDDGGFLRFTNPAVTFIDTFNENGPTTDGDGEIQFNGTRGHNWTAGTISVPEGGVTTGIEAANFERGGGDSFEVGIVDALYDPDADGGLNEYMGSGFELDNGEFGVWQLTDAPFPAGGSHDYTGDGAVDSADADFLVANWDQFNFDDFFWLAQELAPAPAGANSIPEPTSLSLIVSALAMLSGVRRRRR